MNTAIRPSTAVYLVARASLMAAALHMSPVQAQEANASDPADADIIVTARQRSERLQDVPVAISAISKDMIDNYAIRDIGAVGQMTPQVKVSVGGPAGGAQLYIRGIGSTANAGFDPAVGVVIDGVFYNRTMWLTQSFLDMQSIEVLKGPQSLYFGKNTPAGLINVTTASPGARFEMGATAGYEFEAKERFIEGYVSGPITDTFGARLAARFSDMDGWVHVDSSGPRPAGDPLGLTLPGTTNRRLPGTREGSGRLTLQWTPTSNSQATLKLQMNRYTDEGNAARVQIFACQGPGGTAQPIFGVLSPAEDCQVNDRVSRTDVPQPFVDGFAALRDGRDYTDYRSYSAALNFTHDFGWLHLTSVTGWNRYKFEAFGDASYSEAAQFYAYESTHHDAFSQEVRLLTKLDGNVNFLIGGYYQDTDLRYGNSPRIAALPPDPATGNYFTFFRRNRQDGRSLSAFGEITWKIVPQLEIAAGARYTDERKKSTAQNIFINPAIARGFSPNPVFWTTKDHDLSPQVTLTWRPTSEATFYGAYKQGFKAGGFSHQGVVGATTTGAQLAFGPESAEGFEFGAKTTLFGGVLRLDANIYNYLYSDLQVTAFDSQTTSFIVRNAASARAKGVELNANVRLSRQFQLRADVAYAHTRFTNFIGQCYAGQTREAGCNQLPNPLTGIPTSQNLAGKRPPLAPDWNASLGATFRQADLFSQFGAEVNTDLRYSSRYPIDATNRPDVFQEKFATIDASIRLFTADERWSLSVIGRNLTDKAIKLTGADRPGTGGAVGLAAGAPGAGVLADGRAIIDRTRQVRLQIGYKF